MAQQVQFHNKFLFFILFAGYGCSSSKQPHNDPFEILNIDSGNFKIENGILQESRKPFTGAIFTLHTNQIDTLEINMYLQGKENGEWKKYYEKGKRKEIREFVSGKKTGDYIAWWENGNKRLQYTFVNDEYAGNCREWNETGMLVKEMNYIKGHEEGIQRWWYDNGKIKANYVITDGRRYGLLGTKNCINVSDSVFKN